ncbi:MAG: hypothetical protein FJY86_03305 [Candidatus Diapherotrites archaeon]|uniref:Uncharacterized protein n=1 Tax=Candidatus Iainarchaeum sp. TaxID=3101447 RepID=A0A8T4C7D6_9ARCH|nr:hypothetical protein [Candidatus Diapherotrites archaeon]
MKQSLLASVSMRKRMGIWLVFAILFLSVLTLTTISYFTPAQNGLVGLFVHYHFEAMILIGLLGIGIGAASFYLLGQELQASQEKVLNQSTLLLTFLNPLEKECVLFLVKNNGKCYQSDLSTLPGMTRLKAHRMVGKLHERKIIHISSHGKANEIVLVDAWKNGLAEMSV